MQEIYTSELVSLGTTLTELALKSTATAVSTKIKAISNEKDTNKLRNFYGEIITELIKEREDAIRIAQSYKKQERLQNVDLFVIAIYILYEKKLKKTKDVLSFEFPDSIKNIICDYYGDIYVNINLILATMLYQVDLETVKQLQIIRSIENEVYSTIERSSSKQSAIQKKVRLYEIDSLSFTPQEQFSKEIFKFIGKEIFSSCWCSCCKSFSIEYLMKGILSLCNTYKENENFQLLIDEVADLKYDEDKNWQITNIDSYSFYTYLILFRYLKDLKRIENLKKLFLRNMKSIFDFINSNQKDIKSITSFVWVIMFILESLNQNNSVEKSFISDVKQSCNDMLARSIDSQFNKFLNNTFYNCEYLEQSGTVKFLGIKIIDFFKDSFDYFHEQFKIRNINFYARFEKWVSEEIDIDWNYKQDFAQLDYKLEYLLRVFDLIEKYKTSKNNIFLNLSSKIIFLSKHLQIIAPFSMRVLGGFFRFYRQSSYSTGNKYNLYPLFWDKKHNIVENFEQFLELLTRSSQVGGVTYIAHWPNRHILLVLELTILFLYSDENIFIADEKVKNSMCVSFYIDPKWGERYVIKEINNILSSGMYGTEENFCKIFNDVKKASNVYPRNSIMGLIEEALEYRKVSKT